MAPDMSQYKNMDMGLEGYMPMKKGGRARKTKKGGRAVRKAKQIGTKSCGYRQLN